MITIIIIIIIIIIFIFYYYFLLFLIIKVINFYIGIQTKKETTAETRL